MAIAKVVHLANLDIGFRLHGRPQMVYLRRLGYEVHGVTPPGRWITADGLTEDGIPVKVVSYTSSARTTPCQDAQPVKASEKP